MNAVRPLIRTKARELTFEELQSIGGGLVTMDGTATSYTGTGYPASDCDQGWDTDDDLIGNAGGES
jgi:hypothetical protein